jgi:hypothetical protein
MRAYLPEVVWERPRMRVLGYFMGCCAAVLLLSVIIEKRNAEVEIPHVVEVPHAQDEVKPRVGGGPSIKQTVEISPMRDQGWDELCARDNPLRQRPGFTKEMLEACDKREKSKSGSGQ